MPKKLSSPKPYKHGIFIPGYEQTGRVNDPSEYQAALRTVFMPSIRLLGLLVITANSSNLTEPNWKTTVLVK
jgi:hypothetical protein